MSLFHLRAVALSTIGLCALSLAVAACSAKSATSTPVVVSTASPVPTASPTPGIQSRVNTLTVIGQASMGSFNGVPYTETYGTMTGIIDPREAGAGVTGLSPGIVNLTSMTLDANGFYDWSSEFQIVAPTAGAPADTVVLVDSENRGSAISLTSLNQGPSVSSTPANPTGFQGSTMQIWAAGMGNGFLENNATAYARAQWQTYNANSLTPPAGTGGDNASIPSGVQGIGLVVQRDFGRMLAGSTAAPTITYTGGTYTVPTFTTRILTGISQSSWLVTTLIAEGFNVDPVTATGVYQGAVAIDGTGDWEVLNNLGAAAGYSPSQQVAYVPPLGGAASLQLSPSQLLQRPATDPYYIDVANYTDFYRLMAGTTDVTSTNTKFRRYDWPGPHGQGSIPGPTSEAASASVTGDPNGCDNGVPPIGTNPVGYQAYFRAVVLELEHALGVASASGAPSLPPSTLFTLGNAPAATTVTINGTASIPSYNNAALNSPGVPLIDSNGWALGGVRTPDEAYPIGRPTLLAGTYTAATNGGTGMVVPTGGQVVSVPPEQTNSIGNTCGNTGIFSVFSPATLAAMYGSTEASAYANYLSLYDTQLQLLISQGYLLPSDEQYMLNTAGTYFTAAYNGPPYGSGNSNF